MRVIEITKRLRQTNVSYEDRPAINLDELSEPFDPDLLIDMCLDDHAKVLIKGQDFSDVLADAKIIISEQRMFTERSDLNITDDAEIDFIDGNFKKVLYSLKTHEVHFSYDFSIFICERDHDKNKTNKGRLEVYGEGKAWVNKPIKKNKIIEAADTDALPSGHDIIDMTNFCKDVYPNYVMP